MRLTAVVTLLCALVGTLAAYGVERTTLPGRHIWAVLVVVPIAIPDFVIAFGWNSLFTWVQGFRGAVLVMTVAVYPLVYLPVAASLRGADPDQEEVARSLCSGRLRVFWRITVGQARRAILGGSLLVALVVLGEYGAFEILAFRTFTTEIFSEFMTGFDTSSACALSIVLVLLSLVVLFGEHASRGGGRVASVGRGAPRGLTCRRLGKATLPVLLAYTALVGAALGVPVAASVYWIFEGGVHALAGVPLAAAAGYTAAYSAAAAALATLAAIPVALLVVRHPSRSSVLLERSTFLVLGHAGAYHRFSAGVLLRAGRRRVRLPDGASFGVRLRVVVLPARARRGEDLGPASARGLRGGGELARGGTLRGVLPGDAPAHRARSRCSFLPCLLDLRDRAHCYLDLDPDRG